MIGSVVRTGKLHRVDVGTHTLAVLPELAFEGATKRHKPPLKVGIIE